MHIPLVSDLINDMRAIDMAKRHPVEQTHEAKIEASYQIDLLYSVILRIVSIAEILGSAALMFMPIQFIPLLIFARLLSVFFLWLSLDHYFIGNNIREFIQTNRVSPGIAETIFELIFGGSHSGNLQAGTMVKALLTDTLTCLLVCRAIGDKTQRLLNAPL